MPPTPPKITRVTAPLTNSQIVHAARPVNLRVNSPGSANLESSSDVGGASFSPSPTAPVDGPSGGLSSPPRKSVAAVFKEYQPQFMEYLKMEDYVRWTNIRPSIDILYRQHFARVHSFNDTEVDTLLDQFREAASHDISMNYLNDFSARNRGLDVMARNLDINMRPAEVWSLIQTELAALDAWPCIHRHVKQMLDMRLGPIEEPSIDGLHDHDVDQPMGGVENLTTRFRCLGRLGDYPPIDNNDNRELYEEIVNTCIDFESFNLAIQNFRLKWSTKYSPETIEPTLLQITDPAGEIIADKYWTQHQDAILAEASKKGATFVTNYLDRLRKRNWPLSWRKAFKIYIEHGVRQMRSVTADIDNCNKYGLSTEELDWFSILKNGLPETMGRKFAELDTIWATWDTRGKSMHKYDEDTKLWEEKNIDHLRTYISDHFSGLVASIRDKVEKSKTPQTEKQVEKTLQFLDCANVNLQGGFSHGSTIDLDKWTKAACVRLHQRGLNREILEKLDTNIYLFSIKGEKTIEAFPVSRGLHPPQKCLDNRYCVRDRLKTDYFTFESPVTYDPHANMDLVNRFVNSTMIDPTGKYNPELAQFVQDLLGMSLTGLTIDQFLFIFWGEEAGNGKGAIMRTTRKMMGPIRYCAAHKDVYIKAGKTSAGSANPHLAELKGCLLAVGSETDAGEVLNLDQVKGLTGEDPVKSRFLYKNLIEFMVTHKSILLTNNIPTFAMDNGMDRRLIIVGFLAKFKPCICKKEGDESECKCPLLPHERIADPTLEVKLTSEEGRSAWLNFMLEGLDRRCRTLNLKIPECVRNLTQQVKNEKDSILQWMTATCDVKDPQEIVIANEAEVQVSTLYESYCFYCRNRKISHEEQVGEHKFAREMFKRYKTHRGTKQTRYAYYVGITIKQSTSD